jgi:hypothetical protein
MKQILALVLALTGSLALSAGPGSIGPASVRADEAPRSRLLYSGQARVLNLLSGQVSSQAVLLEKVIDPTRSSLTETACVQDPGKPAQVSPVYVRISGETGIVSDDPSFGPAGSLRGSGVLKGTPWNWSYLKFTLTWKNAVTIEDSNFVVGNQLVARKQLFLPDGTPLELWESELTAVSDDAYRVLFAKMGCPGH